MSARDCQFQLLRVQVRFAVPRLRLDSPSALLYSLVVHARQVRYGLVIVTEFRARDVNIRGHLVIVPAVPSLERLLQEVGQLD